eukprot:3158086-Amphidinium_carterae.1
MALVHQACLRSNALGHESLRLCKSVHGQVHEMVDDREVSYLFPWVGAIVVAVFGMRVTWIR